MCEPSLQKRKELLILRSFISGEDSFRDVLINSAAFMLNWKANTIWVDSAKRARTAMAKNYILEIQDRIWQFIKESTPETAEDDFDKAIQVRDRADESTHVQFMPAICQLRRRLRS